MKYEVIESKVYKHKATGRTASPYGARPWNTDAEKEQWELVIVGWTVRNPHTGQIGTCRKPFATKEAAEAFAANNKPSTIGYGD